MRIFSVATCLALTACGQAKPDMSTIENAEAVARQSADASDRIACAPAGATEFKRDCTIERTQDDDGLILTVRQPDGGFHRLRRTLDGRGVIAADGAERAVVTVVDAGLIDVAIGGARYRLPAKVGPLPKQ